MTAHLPECPCSNEDHAHVLAWKPPVPDDCLVCICPALRACTVRVLREARAVVAALVTQSSMSLGHRGSWGDGQRDALAAVDRLIDAAGGA